MSQNTKLLVAVLYVVIITLVKRFYINKKFDIKKSNFIFDCLNFLLAPYFLFVQEYIIAAVWVAIFVMKIYTYKRK